MKNFAKSAYSKSNYQAMSIIKKTIALFSILTLLFACTPEKNNSIEIGDDNNFVHVTGVSFDKPLLKLRQGESAQLSITIIPSNATDKTVTWNSENTGIATVQDGVITAIKDGSTLITVTTNDGGKTAVCNITVEKNLDPAVTIGADKISVVSAILQGKANLGTSAASDLRIGFQYSKSAGILPSNSTTIDAQDADSDYNYTTPITDLEPDTKYYFRSFIRQNGQDTFGETKFFSTREISSVLETLDATGVGKTVAVLHGKLDLTDVKYESIKYGFSWGLSEDSLNTFEDGQVNGNEISASLIGLSPNTEYWFKAYIQLDHQVLFSEVKAFTTEMIPVESISFYNTSLEIYEGDVCYLDLYFEPSNASDKTLVWNSSNESVASVDGNGIVSAKAKGSATITATANGGSNVSASCLITVREEKVDMGIKTSDGKTLYWASRNLCKNGFVNVPELFGDYYAWGEVQTQEEYSWSSYKWGYRSGDKYLLTKYNTQPSFGIVDNKTTLEPEDDVASVILGDKWRIPTITEWNELLTKCSLTRISLNGVNGIKVTADNGNSIFLPAAGWWDNGQIFGENDLCMYFSSSLNTEAPASAWQVILSTTYEKPYSHERFSGESIRPVTE